MTNTIHNVPRELLERAAYTLELAYEVDTPTVRDIRAILSAPSPAGADGLEVVAWRMWNGKTWRFCYSDAHGKRGWEALYTAPQPSAVPDAITMADVMRAWEYAEDHPHKYLRGTTNWCAAVAHSLNQRNQSTPATVQGVNAQLLEALEHARLFIRNGVELGFITMPDADCPDPAHNTLPRMEAAIAAARQEGEK